MAPKTTVSWISFLTIAPVCTLFFHGCLIMTFSCMGAFGQDASEIGFDPPPMRLTLKETPITSLASNDPTGGGDNSNSQDEWQALATSPTPSTDSKGSSPPPQGTTSTNFPSSLVASSKPKSNNPKDDYGPLTGWGLRASAGVALQQQISARFAGGAGYSTYNFSPGFRVDGETFYNLTNGFYFGAEGGFIYNPISSFYRSDFPQGNFVAGSSNVGNAAFYQIPVLGNIRFQIPNQGRLRGYCTGGLGVVWEYLTSSTSLGTNSQHQWNYAFQLGAGFQYNLLPGLDFDTSFKTFITPNPLIFSDGTSQVKASYNYALELGLAYRF